MAKIDDIKNRLDETIYPRTLTKAVYDIETNKNLVEILLEKKLKVDQLVSDFSAHQAEKATLTTLGHVKAETTADGTLIIPEPDIPKSNYNADRMPNENDDSSKGYSKGSTWLFTDANGASSAYKCLNASVGGAIWERYVYESGLAPVPLYDNGNQYVPFKFYDELTGTAIATHELNVDHIRLYTKGGSSGQNAKIGMQSLGYINFSNMNALSMEVEYRRFDSNTSTRTLSFLISADDNTFDNAYVARTQVSINNDGLIREIITIDASNLSGLYFARVVLYASGPSREAEAKIYRMWGA